MAAVNATPTAGSVAPRIDGVRRIAVLRPNAIGDFVFVLPALAALRAAYPDAEIVYLGKRWHREFLTGRPGPIDRVVELPPVPGVGAAPDAAVDEAAIERFIAAMRDERFDLALQLYGGGASSNPFVRRLGARVSAGLQAPGAPALDRSLPYVPSCNERARLLEAVGLVGAPPVDLGPRLAVTDADRAQWQSRWAQARRRDQLAAPTPQQPLVVLQPGASDPRRRWPAERFAAVGDALAERGACIAVNGSADERAVVARVIGAMRSPAIDLSDGLSLSALAALLERACLLVSNDTGPLHLAQAVGARTVGIYWFMNLLVSAPLLAAGHAHAFSVRTACPVCGRENLQQRCEHDASFVADVSLDEVRALALAAFSAATG